MMNTAVFGEGRLPDAPRPRYWAARELVAIGIFAAAANAVGISVTLPPRRMRLISMFTVVKRSSVHCFLTL